jgi:hypothetical protein
MLLEKLPDAVGGNPVKTVFGVAKLILQIKHVCRPSSFQYPTKSASQDVKQNLDAVERRISFTVDQLLVVEEAIAGWKPSNVEETQGMKLFERYSVSFPS